MPQLTAPQIELRKFATKNRAEIQQRFFKTGPGEYGNGDIFIGVTVPDTRAVCKKFSDIEFGEIEKILKSEIHEDRLLGLLFVVEKFKKARTQSEKLKILKFYLKNKDRINNWDLVDVTVHKIVGEFALEFDQQEIIEKLSKSKRHWDKRMAVISTYAFIRKGKVDLTYSLAKKFLNETEDLMHKATGWMLREAGKKNPNRLREFLKKHGKKMPRTMLRYSIEKFTEAERKRILLETRNS
jgi:3-methyladenine DNA glycosylase AlkD